MVVDDSALIRRQVAAVLAGGGYAVCEANDGQDALLQLAAQPDIQLVVCDVNMPRMNGLEFLEQAPKQLPVLMLTTEGQPDVVKRARTLGAKGWLLKPLKPELLLSTIRSFLQ